MEPKLAPSNYETMRSERGPEERRVRGVALLYWLAFGYSALFVILMFAGTWKISRPGVINGPFLLILACICLCLAAIPAVAAWQLGRLSNLGHVLGVLTACSAIAMFPIGTVIGVYALWVLLSDGGRSVFSPEYREAVNMTPGLRFRTAKPIVWAAVLTLAATTGAGLLALHHVPSGRALALDAKAACRDYCSACGSKENCVGRCIHDVLSVSGCEELKAANRRCTASEEAACTPCDASEIEECEKSANDGFAEAMEQAAEQADELAQALDWEGPVAYARTVLVTEASTPQAKPKPELDESSIERAYDEFDPGVRRLKRKALKGCVRESPNRGPDCLTWLAYLDRELARSVFDSLESERRGILKYAVDWDEVLPLETMVEREATMKETGLLDTSSSATDGAPYPLYARELLDWDGVVMWFDAETGSFPNQHDYLLDEIASRARGALDDVTFEEIAPSLEADSRREPYKLIAHSNGKRIEVEAQNLGDWYDVGAVIGMANWLLRDRGSEARVVVLDAADQTVELLVAPESAILDAHSRGWVHVAGGEDEDTNAN